MKKINLFAIALFAVTLTACGASKNVASASQPAQQPASTPVAATPDEDPEITALKKEIAKQKLVNELSKEQAAGAAIANQVVTYDVPCIESSYDDAEYFRDFGIGTVENQNDQVARQIAADAAKSMIKIRLGEYIQGVTDFFVESYSNNKSDKDAAGNRVRRKMNGVVEGMLNNADKICEKPGTDAKGVKHWYYTIQIPKKELNKKMIDIMSEEDKLKRDFDAEQMQKFMDERMAAMLEAKKTAGY